MGRLKLREHSDFLVPSQFLSSSNGFGHRVSAFKSRDRAATRTLLLDWSGHYRRSDQSWGKTERGGVGSGGVMWTQGMVRKEWSLEMKPFWYLFFSSQPPVLSLIEL